MKNEKSIFGLFKTKKLFNLLVRSILDYSTRILIYFYIKHVRRNLQWLILSSINFIVIDIFLITYISKQIFYKPNLLPKQQTFSNVYFVYKVVNEPVDSK